MLFNQQSPSMNPSSHVRSNHTYYGSVDDSRTLQSYEYDPSKHVTRYLPGQILRQQSNEESYEQNNNPSRH